MYKDRKFTVEITVAGVWIEDGFNLNNDNINEHLLNMLPYANSNEITGKVIKKEAIEKKN